MPRHALRERGVDRDLGEVDEVEAELSGERTQEGDRLDHALLQQHLPEAQLQLTLLRQRLGELLLGHRSLFEQDLHRVAAEGWLRRLTRPVPGPPRTRGNRS